MYVSTELNAKAPYGLCTLSETAYRIRNVYKLIFSKLDLLVDCGVSNVNVLLNNKVL